MRTRRIAGRKRPRNWPVVRAGMVIAHWPLTTRRLHMAAGRNTRWEGGGVPNGRAGRDELSWRLVGW